MDIVKSSIAVICIITCVLLLEQNFIKIMSVVYEVFIGSLNFFIEVGK